MRISRRSALQWMALGLLPAAGCAHRHAAGASLTAADDFTAGWTRSRFPDDPGGRVYFRREAPGPPVVVLHEILGLERGCFDLGNRLYAKGFSVLMPKLFGEVGGHNALVGYFRSCATGEFSCAASDRSSAILPSIAAFCEEARRLSDDRPVGVIGMCLTGAFPIWLLRTPAVTAPVVCQPTMPFTLLGAGESTALGLSAEDLRPALRRRDVSILGLRFTRDWRCPPQRFTKLRELFGARFTAREIPSGLERVPRDAHSVLVGSYQTGGPTHEAFRLTVDFLNQRLRQ
jgi:dienelactone hydrolase